MKKTKSLLSLSESILAVRFKFFFTRALLIELGVAIESALIVWGGISFIPFFIRSDNPV
jgi:hypothetical protein